MLAHADILGLFMVQYKQFVVTLTELNKVPGHLDNII
jgi:hypothetical protein